MTDHEHHGNHIIEEENDQESIENPQQRPFTTGQQRHNGKRAASKNDNFYGSLTNERLPIVFPQSRPYSEKAVKPGRPTLKTNTYKPSERNSMTPKETEMEHHGRAGSVPMRYQPPAQAQGMLKTYIRVIPKNIPQDRERLYDEAMHLKNNLHELQTENLRMKTRITFLERESVKFEKIMAQHQHENHLAGERNSAPRSTESHLVLGLKNKVKELEAVLHAKETELTKIKRTLKYTKLHELEAEVKVFSDENYRLKNILEHVVKDKIDNLVGSENRTMLQEECVLQSAHIQVLERDFKEAVLAVNKLEEQNSELEKRFEDSEKKRSKESHRLKKLLNEAEKEKARLKTEASAANLQPNPIPIFPTGKKTVTGYTKEEFNMMELEKKKAENASLHDQLAEKAKYIQSLEKQLKEVSKISTERHSQFHTAEKHSSKSSDRTEKPVPQNHRTELSVHSVVESKHPEEKTVKIIEPEKVQKSVVSSPPVEKVEKVKEEVPEEPVVQKEEAKQKSVPRKRVQKVRVEDVKDFGYEMNLNLRARGITFEQLSSEIWPESSLETGRISVKEVIEILRNDPFNVKNEEDSELIARYLVEENREEYLYFDEDVEGEVVIVKSILKKLIGHIPKWDKESAQHLLESISEICIKNYGSLRENLRVMCKSGYLDKRGLQEACKLVDVHLSEDQMEFIITKLFEKSNNLHKLAIEDLFIIFNQKPKYEERAPSVQSKDDRRSSKGSDREQPVHHEPVVAQKKPDNLILVNETKPKEVVNENVTKPKEPLAMPGTRDPNMLNLGGSGSIASKRESEEKSRFERSRDNSDEERKPEKKLEEKPLVVEKAPLKLEQSQFESFGAKPKEAEKNLEVQEYNDEDPDIYEDHEGSEASDKEDHYEKFSEKDEEEDNKRNDKDQEEYEQEEGEREEEQDEQDEEEEQEQRSEAEQKYDEEEYEDDHEGHAHENHNSLAPRSQAQDQDEVDSQAMANSRNQLASQRTDHTNATQFTEPKSEGYEAHKRTPMAAAPEEDKVEEDEEEEREQEDEEQEEEQEEEQDEKGEEYEEEDAFEEEEEHEKVKERSIGSGDVLQKSKVKSEDYDDNDMGFEEEEEDVKKRNSSRGSDAKQVKGKAKAEDYDNDEIDFEGEEDF